MEGYRRIGKNEAKPCPFCGSNNLGIIAATNIYNFDNTHPCHVFCHKCGGTTGYRASDKDALETWNNRVIE